MPRMADIDQNAARAIVDDAVRAGPEGGLLPADEAARLLAAYGVQVWPTVVVTSLVEAVAGAAEVGYPVALKATAEPLRHRPELGTVRLDISNEDELRTAYEAMAAISVSPQPSSPYRLWPRSASPPWFAPPKTLHSAR